MMFEKFTERGRKVIVYAREEAERLLARLGLVLRRDRVLQVDADDVAAGFQGFGNHFRLIAGGEYKAAARLVGLFGHICEPDG